jgi:hypothetical protein
LDGRLLVAAAATKRKYLAGRQCVGVPIGNVLAGASSLAVFALFNVAPPTPK